MPDADIDASILLGFVLGMGRGELAAKQLTETRVNQTQAEEFIKLIGRRSKREPLQHIVGVAWFRNLTLVVGPGVFVPRPETEVLAGMAIDALRSQAEPAPIAVDLGTGSGAIALSLATEVPHAQVYALEKSNEAMPWTSRNFENISSGNAFLAQGDIAGPELLAAFPHLEGAVSVIVSNPPYIPSDAIPVYPEVHLFDPEMALYAGPDGLDFMRVIAQVGLVLGRPGAQLLVEHSEHQGIAIREIFEEAGWRSAATFQDFTGRDRYTTATHA